MRNKSFVFIKDQSDQTPTALKDAACAYIFFSFLFTLQYNTLYTEARILVFKVAISSSVAFK